MKLHIKIQVIPEKNVLFTYTTNRSQFDMHNFSTVTRELSYEVHAIQMPVMEHTFVQTQIWFDFKFKAHCFQHYYNQIIIIFTSAAIHNMHTADATQNKVIQKQISGLK
jgi:hypothetical protein